MAEDGMLDWLAIHVALGTAIFSETCAILFVVGRHKDMADATAQTKRDRRGEAGGATETAVRKGKHVGEELSHISILRTRYDPIMSQSKNPPTVR
jgi:hypothetical protein